jgi:hypothetical protein
MLLALLVISSLLFGTALERADDGSLQESHEAFLARISRRRPKHRRMPEKATHLLPLASGHPSMSELGKAISQWKESLVDGRCAHARHARSFAPGITGRIARSYRQ